MDIVFLIALALAGSFVHSLAAFCLALFTVPRREDDAAPYVVSGQDTLLTFDDLPTR